MYDSNQKKDLILNILLIIYGIFFQVVILNKLLKYSDFISAAFILIILAIAISILGFKRDSKNNLKTNIFYRTCILVILFFAIIYLVGLFIGFNQNAYSLNPLNMINNTFSVIIIIICVEFYRYILINSVNEKSKLNLFTTITLIIFEISISIKVSSIISFAVFFQMLTTIIFPIISKNIVMSSLCKHGGLRSTLFYRLIMDLYFYVMPIIPDFNDYIISMIGMCYPFVIYIFTIDSIYKEKEVIKLKSFKDELRIGDVIVTTLVICMIMLLSGVFPLTMIGVGSESMNPKINKGDAVIYKKIKSDKDLKIGDIIVFEYGEKTVVHRLIEKLDLDGTTYYVTKGDSNNKFDDVETTIDEIKGVVILKLKYIAYPSVYFGELLNERS